MPPLDRLNGYLPKTWCEPAILPIPNSYQQAIGTIPLVTQILYKRGLIELDVARGFLDESLYQPASPLDLQDLGKSTTLLQNAIKQNKRIGVWGDFDVDGQTATAILVSALQELGASISYHIPIRANESHGVNLTNLEKLLNQGIGLLVTCDTGISSHDAVDYAHSKGVQVIITDHHDLPQDLPQADAIINPKRLPKEHRQRNLPGVGVAYQLVHELCRQADRPELSQSFLDLVALGIVADLATVKDDTRWLLQRGLKILRSTTRVGLQVLLQMAELNPENITEEHISFYLAPRLNAMGRLSDANIIVEFFTTNDIGKARLIAVELEGLNSKRKLITDQVFQAAQAQLQANPKILQGGIIVLSHPTWPAGVIGIVASRLVEHYNLPTILFSAPPGQVARGSARSVEGIDITKVIATQDHLLESFGGHPMAAGLGIQTDRIPELYRSLVQTIQHLKPYPESKLELQIDGYLTLPELSLDFVSELERIAPYGPGNPAPILASRRLVLSGYTAVGRSAEHLLLNVEDETGFSRKVIWWKGAGWPLPTGIFDLAYSVRTSTYRGQKDIQVEWVDFRQAEDPSGSIEITTIPIKVVDYRDEVHPIPLLERLSQKDNTQLWGEATKKSNFSFLDRYKLSGNCANLVIWTIPPGPDELLSAIKISLPQTIYLFGVNPGLDTPETFLKYLAGLVKYSLKVHNGRVNLSTLAAASSHRIRTIQAGIYWLQSHGHVQILDQDGDNLLLKVGSKLKYNNALTMTQQVKLLLDETQAYRTYYLHADQLVLINL